MGRQPCCDKAGLKRGPWTIEEDHKLMTFILNNGIHCWRLVPKLAGLLRCGKSCRLRWINYLRPDLKRGSFTENEENQIIQLHSRLGNRWSMIASHFPGRTDNEIKNHWNTKIKKRLKLLGLDPVTHRPIEQIEKSDNDNDNDDKKVEIIPNEPITSTLEEKNSEVDQKPKINLAKDDDNRKEERDQSKLISDDLGTTFDLFKNYETLGGNIDFGCSWNQEKIISIDTISSSHNSCSSMLSIEESINNNVSIDQSPSIQKDNNSFNPAWDGFDNLEYENLFCLENYYQQCIIYPNYIP